MRWEANAKRKWRRWFALWPTLVDGEWVWLETFWAWPAGDCTYLAREVPDEIRAYMEQSGE